MTKEDITRESTEAIMRDGTPLREADKTLIVQVLGCSKEILGRAWGEKEAGNFFDFASHIDASHPDLNSIFSEEETKILLDAIKLQKFCVTESCQLSDKTAKLIPLEIRKKLRSFGNPMENRCQVRMLLHPEDRRTARSYKAVRPVEMDACLKKGEGFWKNHIDNFSLYIRHGDMFSGEVDKARMKAEHYRKLGCMSLCDEIGKSIEVFQKQLDEDYLGFHRINLTSAAIILAKNQGFVSHFGSRNRIKIMRPAWPGMDLNRAEYDYCPRVYPWHVVEDKASERMNKIVARMESFPECRNKPIFDHLLVLVPSISATIDCMCVADKKQMTLDWELVRLGCISPILIGERDGKCYFITYF